MNRKFTYIILLLLAGVNILGQDYYQVKRTSFSLPTFNEFAPTYYQDGIVFCTDRSTKVFITYTTPENNNLLNLHTITYKDKANLKWENNSELFTKDETFTTNYNEGPACFSADEQTIYFTRTNDINKSFGNRLRGDTTYGIYTAERNGDSWANIKPFKYTKISNNVGFPFLTADGNTLYFCSNMQGGYGGLDIWKVDKKGKGWGRAENLGPVINTEGNEVFPFVHISGRLYFSSNGHHNRADTDIYFADIVDGEYTQPVNMVFNSRSDDFGLIINETLDTGFFASNKRRGSDDIYQFYSEYPSFKNCPPQEENSYCYLIEEQGSMTLDTTSFRYEWDLGDGTKIRSLRVEHCYKKTGNYTIQLNVIDTLTGEIFFSEATYQLEVTDIEQPFISVEDTVFMGEKVAFNARNTNLPGFDIDNYYWDFGMANRFSGESISFTFDHPGQYQVQLGVASNARNRRDKPEKKCVTRKIVVLNKTE